MASIPEFGIPRDDEERRDGGCGVIFDPQSQKYAVGKFRDSGRFILFGGGVDANEDMQQGVLREISEESGLHDFLHIEELSQVIAHYRNKAKNVNRLAHATCFLLILKSTDLAPLKLEEHEKFDLVWATAEEIIENWESRNEERNHDHWIYFLKMAVSRIQELGYDKSIN